MCAQKRLDTCRPSSCWSGVLSVHGMSTSETLLQIAAGGGDKMDDLKGYCCLQPHLKSWFKGSICRCDLWTYVAQSGCRDQSYFITFGMFYPLAINENVLEDLASNCRRGNYFWALRLADALWKVLCYRNWVFGPLNWRSRSQWYPKSVVALRAFLPCRLASITELSVQVRAAPSWGTVELLHRQWWCDVLKSEKSPHPQPEPISPLCARTAK